MSSFARFRRWAIVLMAAAGISAPAPAQQGPVVAIAPVDDPLLVEFVGRLVARHPRLAAASAVRDAAVELGNAASRPLYNPSLEFDYEDAVDKTWSVGIGQNIDWTGKRKARSAAASATASATGADLSSTRNEIAGRVFRQLAEYWIADELLRLADQRSKLFADFAVQARNRRLAGDLSIGDENLAAMSLANARLQQAQAQARFATRVQQLLTLGAPANRQEWPAMPETLPAIPAQARDAASIVDRLPQITAAHQRVVAARAQADLAKRLTRPDPSLQLRAGAEANDTLLGVNVAIPIPVRNNFRAQAEAARFQALAAQADERASRLNATRRVLVSMETYAALRNAWEDWEQSGSQRVEQQTELLQRLWASGDLSIDEFLLRTRTLLEFQITVMRTRGQLLNAWTDWLVASGQAAAWLGLETTQ